MKSINLLAVWLLVMCFVSSCTKEDSLSLSLTDQYSSFEVDVAATPVAITTIANSAYTSPETPYGQSPVIDFRVNIDNTVDVFWLDNTKKRHISRVSLSDKKLVEEITIPSVANNGGRFLGFEKWGDNKFIIGYSKANSFGNIDAEAWYTAFDKSGVIYFSTRIFGNMDQTLVNSKGSPSQAGSATITFNASANVFCIYLAHTQRYSDNVRHQAGWVGFINAANGAVLTKTSGTQIGSGWFYSHNFDQRCMLSSYGMFYTLAHGDSYPRSLGIALWSHQTGIVKDFEYYKIQNSKPGDNTTLATTGDFVEMPDGSVSVVYSTSDTRTKRDLKLAVISGLKEKAPVIVTESWITNYSDQSVGWGSKICNYGTDLLIGWNSFVGNSPNGSHIQIVDKNGKAVSNIENFAETCFYPSQSLRKSADSKQIVWVSAGAKNKLKIHTVKLN